MNFLKIYQSLTVLIFLSNLPLTPIFAKNFELPPGRWKEKKGTAELIISPDNILFRKLPSEEMIRYPVAIVGRVRNEFWLEFSGKNRILESDKVLLIFQKYTLEVIFFSENKPVEKYIFEK